MIPHDPEPVGSVVDREIPGPAGPIPVRVYRPLGAGAAPLPWPCSSTAAAGWCVTSTSHDGMCRAICNTSGCVVMAVDYRLAPEHESRAGVEDRTGGGRLARLSTRTRSAAILRVSR